VFSVEIKNGLAVFHLKRHFPSLETAERTVSEFLRSFDADEIFQSSEPVKFDFQAGRMQSGSSIYVGLQFSINIVGALAEANTRERTPWQRPTVGETPEGRALLARYEAYKAGSEQLTTVAYVCLSHLQDKAGGRKKGAALYLVDQDVLDRIGTLSSEHGDLSSARKIDSTSSRQPLNPSDIHWLETATRRVIKRISEIEAGEDLKQIKMSDLP
jgi:hypothetical protein